MARHATTSNAAPACQTRQLRLWPTGIGSKCLGASHFRLRATRKPFCDWRTLASYLKRVEVTM